MKDLETIMEARKKLASIWEETLDYRQLDVLCGMMTALCWVCDDEERGSTLSEVLAGRPIVKR